MSTTTGCLPRQTAGARLIGAGVAASFLVTLLPILLFDGPVLLDYQNHVARMWLITNAGSDRYYVVSWDNISSDLGVDIAAFALRNLMTPGGIARLCLVLAVALPPLGVVALNRRLFGRIGASCMLVPFFSWTLTALAGFLNFQIGLGLALIAVAADPLLGPSWWARFVGRSLFGLVILIDHGLALTFYMLLLIGLHLGSVGQPVSMAGLRRDVSGALGAAATAAIVPLCLVLVFTGTMPGDHDPSRHAGMTSWNTHRTLLMSLVSPLSTYNARVDEVIALALAGLVMACFRLGKASWHAGLLLVAAGMYAASLFMPRGTAFGGWTDRRLPIMALLTILASVQFTFPTWRRRRVLGLAAIGLVSFRTAWIGWNWAGGQAMQDSTARALALMAPGAKLLAVQHAPSKAEISASPAGRFIYGNEITYRHLPTLAIVLRQAFVPTLFTQRGVHPVHVGPACRQLSEPEGGDLPPIAVLMNEHRKAPAAAYLQDWQSRFDYVLVLNADYPDASGSNRLPSSLRLVSDQGFAQLFSIARDSGR